MKLFTLLTLACIMAAAMNAQTLTGLPEHKVELSGTPDSPFVINGSPKTIVAYVLRKVDDTGGITVDATRFTTLSLPTGLPIGPGATDLGRTLEGRATRIHHDGTPLTWQSVSLDLVLFSDGTMVGPNTDEWLDSWADIKKMDKPTLIKAMLDIEGRKQQDFLRLKGRKK